MLGRISRQCGQVPVSRRRDRLPVQAEVPARRLEGMDLHVGQPRRPESEFHPASLLEHQNTKVHAPYTNGCERFQTVSDEFFKVALPEVGVPEPRGVPRGPGHLAQDVQHGRAHYGYWPWRRIPLQTFEDGPIILGVCRDLRLSTMRWAYLDDRDGPICVSR